MQVSAQEVTGVNDAPGVEITGVDVSEFPNVRVTVYGENINAPLLDLPLALYEDGSEREVAGREMQEVGVQTAFLFDASNNALGEYGSFRAAVDELTGAGVLSSETDWLAAFSTGDSEDNFRVIADWSRNHGSVYNKVVSFQPAPQSATEVTPLFDLIDFALTQLSEPGRPEHAIKSIIVFSDGFDATSDLDESDVLGAAEEQGVRIHTVMLFPLAEGEQNAAELQRQNNLERIARLTGGLFARNTDDLAPLWQEQARQRTQMAVHYRSGKAQPAELSLALQTPGGQALRTTERFPVLDVQPVQIAIAEPAGETPIVRTASEPDQPLGEIEPLLLPIELNIAWPDEQPRMLQRIEYILNDETRVQTEPPFGQFAFPIGHLGAGNYTLRITAVDEFGIEGKSDPLPLQIVVDYPVVERPAESAPVAEPVAEEEATGYALESIIFLGAAGLVLALLLLFLFSRFRRRSAQDESSIPPLGVPEPSIPEQNWSEIPSSTYVDEATDVPDEPAFRPVPAAYLTATESVPGHFPHRIPLFANSVVRIGRRADLVDVVLEDRKISRLHATITQQADGFYIQDDGSTSKTYVNKRELSASDNQLLRANDEVSFYSFTYRFVSEDESTDVPDESPFMDEPRTVPAHDESDENTELIDYS